MEFGDGLPNEVNGNCDILVQSVHPLNSDVYKSSMAFKASYFSYFIGDWLLLELIIVWL